MLSVESLIEKHHADIYRIRSRLLKDAEYTELTPMQLRLWEIDRDKAGNVRDMSYKLQLPRRYIEYQLAIILYKVTLDYLETEYEYGL